MEGVVWLVWTMKTREIVVESRRKVENSSLSSNVRRSLPGPVLLPGQIVCRSARTVRRFRVIRLYIRKWEGGEGDPEEGSFVYLTSL